MDIELQKENYRLLMEEKHALEKELSNPSLSIEQKADLNIQIQINEYNLNECCFKLNEAHRVEKLKNN